MFEKQYKKKLERAQNNPRLNIHTKGSFGVCSICGREINDEIIHVVHVTPEYKCKCSNEIKLCEHCYYSLAYKYLSMFGMWTKLMDRQDRSIKIAEEVKKARASLMEDVFDALKDIRIDNKLYTHPIGKLLDLEVKPYDKKFKIKDVLKRLEEDDAIQVFEDVAETLMQEGRLK